MTQHPSKPTSMHQDHAKMMMAEQSVGGLLCLIALHIIIIVHNVCYIVRDQPFLFGGGAIQGCSQDLVKEGSQIYASPKKHMKFDIINKYCKKCISK